MYSRHCMPIRRAISIRWLYKRVRHWNVPDKWVSIFKNLFGKEPGAENKISRYVNADYYQTVIRLSRGQIDHSEILNPN